MPEYRNHKQLCGGEMHAADFSVKYLVIIINLGHAVNKLVAVRRLSAAEIWKRQGLNAIFFGFVLLGWLVLSDKE